MLLTIQSLKSQRTLFLAVLFFCFISSYSQEEKLSYPVAYKSAAQNNYFGTVVKDPYQWLEDDTLSATRKWVEDENDLTIKYMNKALARYPLRDQLRMNSYYDFGTIYRSGKYFFDFMRSEHASSSSMYIKKKIGESSQPDLIVDPADYSKGKEKVFISGFEMSGNNKLLAFVLSRNGSDWMEIRVKEVYPSKKLPDLITGVKFSDIKWKGNGFFYCRYQSLHKDKPLTSITINPCIYYHTMGTTQENDSLIFEYPGDITVGTVDFDVVEQERFLIVHHISGTGEKLFSQISFFDFQNPDQKKLKKLLAHPKEDHKSFHVIGFLNGKFLVKTNLGASYGHILSFDPSLPGKAQVVIPQLESVLVDAQLIDHKIVCQYLEDIDRTCIVFDGNGKVIKRFIYPVGSSVSGFEGTNADSTTIFYFHSFLHPPIVYEYNLRTQKISLIQQTEISYHPQDFTIEKIYYRSKDGERIPMIIAHKKGLKRTGTAPTILYGYGGYGLSLTPFFDIGFISHLRNGGIVALPCIRGGGEYGEEWHKKGMLENKQNVFDDFIAAAEYLIDSNYTHTNRLALMGGSNGGLLVGAVLTQRPDLFKVAVCEVGVYDMLRYQNYTVGFAWKNEFGVSSDSAQFQYLYKYSPLHAVKEGVSYPATLLITSDHDDRVVPMHSRKFAATLQEKTAGANPVLLYTQKNLGHHGESGAGTTAAYIYAFIYQNIGLKPREINITY